MHLSNCLWHVRRHDGLDVFHFQPLRRSKLIPSTTSRLTLVGLCLSLLGLLHLTVQPRATSPPVKILFITVLRRLPTSLLFASSALSFLHTLPLLHSNLSPMPRHSGATICLAFLCSPTAMHPYTCIKVSKRCCVLLHDRHLPT